ncbi:MAG: hypothetical protein H7Z11_12760 [Verrucomicrobia bacterium]|nr:hypothetical protein [Leptolyngbya sp. ES-bin-22]
MKGLVYGGLAVLLLTTASAAMSEETTRVQAELAQSEASSMIFNFTAPIITNSGVLGSTHFIRIAVIGMTLKDLQVSLPKQMDRFDGLRVIDQSGKEVSSKISLSKERVEIVFDKPVAPGGYLQLEFSGIRMVSPRNGTLFYGVTGQRVGLSGEIPVGTATIQLPERG